MKRAEEAMERDRRIWTTSQIRCSVMEQDQLKVTEQYVGKVMHQQLSLSYRKLRGTPF